MRYEIDGLAGLIFTHPETREEYGHIRPCKPGRARLAGGTSWTPIADDDCGNAFLLSPEGAVAFWDHETNEILEIASTWPGFVAGCTEPKPVELDPSKVNYVWVDPSFAKEHGIKVDKDVFKKKP
jgi:hypothetical protein